jgi:assimilatory nitrate reductase catalytic subunit
VLSKLYPAKIYVEIHPDDAARIDVQAGDTVIVRSRRASLEAVVFITATISPGQVFLPMHYAETNRLTLWGFDPHSRQPSYKACAVAVAARVNGKDRP